jgi:hypothetical protein
MSDHRTDPRRWQVLILLRPDVTLARLSASRHRTSRPNSKPAAVLSRGSVPVRRLVSRASPRGARRAVIRRAEHSSRSISSVGGRAVPPPGWTRPCGDNFGGLRRGCWAKVPRGPASNTIRPLGCWTSGVDGVVPSARPPRWTARLTPLGGAAAAVFSVQASGGPYQWRQRPAKVLAWIIAGVCPGLRRP